MSVFLTMLEESSLKHILLFKCSTLLLAQEKALLEHDGFVFADFIL